MAALEELEMDDIEVIGDQRFDFELVGDEGLGPQRLRRKETHFVVKARKGEEVRVDAGDEVPGRPKLSRIH